MDKVMAEFEDEMSDGLESDPGEDTAVPVGLDPLGTLVHLKP